MTGLDRDWNNFRRTLARLESWGLAESAVSAHLADLGAEEVSRLRHEGTHVGGVAPTDYERPSKAAVGLFCDKLKRLVKLGGKDLVVSESPALGGFGHRVHGDLYNLDTLKHLEVLIALRRGGLLDEMMRAEERRLVVQVGPGWGGFAMQLKTLCPHLTLVLHSPPESLLLSSVYLMRLFPDARCAFHGPGDPEVEWTNYDFVFTPGNDSLFLVGPPPHLLVSVQGFESLTGVEVAGMVEWAYEAGCPFLYSLDTHCADEPDTTAVSVFERAYWPHEIPVMPVGFDEMLDGLALGKTVEARARRAAQPEPRYRHVVGWRRRLR